MKAKFKNYELYSLSFIILNLDIFILLNSLIPIYNLDTVKVFIYVIELIPLFCLSRHLYLYIKIKSKMKEIKNKYNILFISLTLALLIYALIINTTYSYFHEGGFNSLILLLNIILLVIHNVLFLYYENKGKDNEKIKEYNDLILTNSLINKDNEENKKNCFKIHTLYYLLALVPGTILSSSYFYMILKTSSYDLGYIFSNFTFLSVLIIISLLIYIVILVILGIFSYKNKFYKPYKIVLIPVINILSLVLIMGNYTGFRLSELKRFKPLAVQIKENLNGDNTEIEAKTLNQKIKDLKNNPQATLKKWQEEQNQNNAKNSKEDK